MSSVIRYKTLIPFLTGLYVTEDTNSRTQILREGLLGLTDSSQDWSTIRMDAERMLAVWSSKESDPAAREVVAQILNVLGEFADSSTPVLVITDHAVPRIEHVAPAPHVIPVFEEDEDDDEVEEEVEVEAEVENEDEDEDEEEGMEVEVRTIRGKKYWYEAKTRKLFAIEGEDDVGDEVGILLANGTPVLLVSESK